MVDAVSKQLSIQRARLRATRSHPQGGPARSAKIKLHIPHNRPGHKRKIHTTVEPLTGSDAPGKTVAIDHILARSIPKRRKHGRRSTWLEEFLVRWEPETCTFGNTLEQYRLGFDILSITYLEENIPSHSLQPFVSEKRLNKVQRRTLRRPSLITRCTVQYAPSLQGPRHIHSIAGVAQALDSFLVIEMLSLSSTDTSAKVEPRPSHIKRSSLAQAPTRTKRGKHPYSPERGETTEHTPPASPAPHPRRPHIDLLHMVTVEGYPDRGSIPRP